MTRQRTNSYSSSTLSSTSSGASSTATYASIRSLSSYASRLSLQIKSTDFWGQFERNSRKRQSVSSVFRKMFSKRSRGEPEKNQSAPLEHTTYHFPVIPVSRLSTETSFTERRETPPSSLKRHGASPSPFAAPLSSCPAPAGLYCVIEDFLTEYDLRILEEEERAEMIARRSKEISWERENIRTVRCLVVHWKHIVKRKINGVFCWTRLLVLI